MQGHFMGCSSNVFSIVSLCSIATALASSACSGSEASGEKIVLAGLTADQRYTMVELALGDLEDTVVLISLFAEPSTGCPRISVTDTSVSIQGGCTDEEGDQWTGSLRMNGSTASVTFDLDGFGVVSTEGAFSMDGSVRLSETELSSELEVSSDGEVHRIEAERTQLASGGRDDEGTVERVGSGYAELDGQWNLDDREDFATGSLELRGVDTLKIDFSQRDARGCAATTLDGVADTSTCIDDDIFLTPRSPLTAFRAALRRALR